MTTELERRLSASPVPLPPGAPVLPEEGGPACYWLSDGPVGPGVWPAFAAAFPRTGLWPLLVEGLDGDPERPWQAGEVDPTPGWTPAGVDAAQVLAGGWADASPDPEEDDPELLAALAPFTGWPGLAPAGEYRQDPEAVAARVADRLAAARPHRLVLVAVARGADCLDETGWQGYVNAGPEPGDTAAVLRSWESRFGVRLVAAGFDTVVLSVGAPPRTVDHALRVAAEHLAFCSDNVHQGAGSLTEYAPELVDADEWSFWWD